MSIRTRLAPFVRFGLLVGALAVGFQTAFAGAFALATTVTHAAQDGLRSFAPAYTSPPPAYVPPKNPGRDTQRLRVFSPAHREAMARLDRLYAAMTGTGNGGSQGIAGGTGGGITAGGTTSGGVGQGGPVMGGESAYVLTQNKVEAGGAPNQNGGSGKNGVVGEANTANGNYQTSVPLTSWRSRGRLSMGLELRHSSRSEANLGWGTGWIHSYNMVVTTGPGGVATVHYGNGLAVPYTKPGSVWVPSTPGYFDRLEEVVVNGTTVEWRLTQHNQTTYVFSTVSGAAVLTSIRDRKGNTITVEREPNNPLLVRQVTDADGQRWIRFGNVMHEAATEFEPAKWHVAWVARGTGANDESERWSFTYTSDYKDLTVIAYPATEVGGGSGPSRSFTYDSRSNIVAHTDLRGAVWQFDYYSGDPSETPPGPGDAIRSATRPSAGEAVCGSGVGAWPCRQRTTFYYNVPPPGVVGTVQGRTWIQLPAHSVTNGVPQHHRILHQYNLAGAEPTTLYSVTDEASFTTYYDYDAEHLVSRVFDARGFDQWFQYDVNGNLLQYTDQRDRVWKWGYDLDDNDLLWSMTPEGEAATPDKRTEYTYYSDTHSDVRLRGLLEKVVDSTGRTLLQIETYDDFGQPEWVRDGLNRLTQYDLDGRGNLLSVTDPAGHQTVYTHTPFGRVETVTEPGAVATSVVYDRWDRPVSIVEGAATTSMVYDGEGNVTSRTCPRGFTTDFVYNLPGWLTDRLTPWNGTPPRFTQSYGYDHMGRVVSVTNGNGYTRTIQRAARGEVYRMFMPVGSGLGTETYRYLPTGELAEYVNGMGQRIEYRIGGDGRLAIVRFPDKADTVYTRNLDGEVTRMVDASGTTDFERDLEGRVTRMVSPVGELTYGYDATGARTTMTEVGYGTTTWAYDAQGRLDTVTNPLAEVTDHDYDTATGRLWRLVHGNGTREEYGYDGRGRVNAITLRQSAGGAVLRSQGYTFLADGRVHTHTVDGVVTTYGYDGEGQLLTESRPGYSGSYTYDGNFNRLTRTVNGVTDTYHYAASQLDPHGDRLLKVTRLGSVDRVFEYDGAGRTLRELAGAGGSVVRSFAWDSEGRLTSATGAWGTRSYAYNGAGARVRETGGAAQRDFFRAGASVLAPVLRDGTGAGSFRYTPGLSVRAHGAPSSRFAHTGLKTTDSQTDGSAGLASTLTYDAFGSLTGSTGSWQGNYGYAGGFGYHADPTGLKQVGHRYYDPDLGRFLSRDPIKDGPNWYAYCLNDPVNRVDPNGLQFMQFLRFGAPMFGKGNLFWFRGIRFDRNGAGGSKTYREFVKHWRNNREARKELADLYGQLRNAKSHRERVQLRERIGRLERDIRGHEKEMDEKWGSGWRDHNDWGDVEPPMPSIGPPAWWEVEGTTIG